MQGGKKGGGGKKLTLAAPKGVEQLVTSKGRKSTVKWTEKRIRGGGPKFGSGGCNFWEQREFSPGKG